MHVLMLCALDVWSLDRGAGAPTLERTLRAYAEAGHRVSVVLPDIGANHFHDPRRPATAESRPEIAGVTFQTFHMPSLRDLPPLASLPATVERADQKLRFAVAFPWIAARHAERLLREADAPVDVFYGYEVHGVLAARLLRRRMRQQSSPAWRGDIPLVARFQGTVMHPALSNVLLYARRYEEALALKTPADLYIMTDDGTRGDEVLARLNTASKGRVRFWRNGLDLDRLRPPSPDERRSARESLGVPEDAFVMLTASRLAAWKRVDRVIRALPRVRAWVPQALLLVVGDGEERARLEALTRELGVAAAVRFTGAVPQREVTRYMRSSDAFLAAADLSNVGNPLLEAMACGVCVVAVDAGDTRDVIADGATGRLVDPSQRSGVARPLEERLGDLLVQLAGDAPQRERLGAAAAAYARTHFWTWEQRMAAEVSEVASLVEGARSPQRRGSAEI